MHTKLIEGWRSIDDKNALGGRWVETAEMPVPFAIRFLGGEVAAPAKLAQRIVEGGDPLESMATEVEPLTASTDR